MGPAQAPLVVTCEHASAAVPTWARAALGPHLSAAARQALAAALRSHQGVDFGAAAFATALARSAHAPCILGRATRLLIDLNRSAKHPALFSTFTRPLPVTLREQLRRRLWWPHWQAVANALRRARAAHNQSVYHVAAHSFDPDLALGRERIDVGLLYDPARALECAWVGALRAALGASLPMLRVRRNAPYRGVSDGLTTALRKRLGPADYAGIEIEVNQFLTRTPQWPRIQWTMAQAIARAPRGAAGGAKLR